MSTKPTVATSSKPDRSGSISRASSDPLPMTQSRELHVVSARSPIRS